jgi:hypothetical protein
MDIKFELTTIQENAFIYETHLKNVNRRRDMWHKTVKDKVWNTLDEVRKNFHKIDWHVHIDDTKTNMVSIALKINDASSGIIEAAKGENVHKEYMKRGAQLGFSQMISGKINVWFDFPYWEDLQISKQLRKHMVTIEPSYVTESLIAGYVHQFLQEITSFESNV